MHQERERESYSCFGFELRLSEVFAGYRRRPCLTLLLLYSLDRSDPVAKVQAYMRCAAAHTWHASSSPLIKVERVCAWGERLRESGWILVSSTIAS
jgi:hypothetical protein